MRWLTYQNFWSSWSSKQFIEDVEIGGARNHTAGFQQVRGYVCGQASPGKHHQNKFQ